MGNTASSTMQRKSARVRNGSFEATWLFRDRPVQSKQSNSKLFFIFRSVVDLYSVYSYNRSVLRSYPRSIPFDSGQPQEPMQHLGLSRDQDPCESDEQLGWPIGLGQQACGERCTATIGSVSGETIFTSNSRPMIFLASEMASPHRPACAGSFLYSGSTTFFAAGAACHVSSDHDGARGWPSAP